MRAYLVVTGLIFAFFTLLDIWQLFAGWSGFDEGFWVVLASITVTIALTVWAWRLLRATSAR